MSGMGVFAGIGMGTLAIVASAISTFAGAFVLASRPGSVRACQSHVVTKGKSHDGEHAVELDGAVDVLRRLIDRIEAIVPNNVRERSHSDAYKHELSEQMPTLLDIVTLGLSAGLSFDASLDLYCRRYQNELSKAMAVALMSWRIGMCGREEALENVANKYDVAAMRRFASTVSESLAFGAPLAEALERQAEVVRDEQRSELQEEMEKVPVKMLIPLGTLIVPAMLIAILGPLLAPTLGGS